MGHVFKKITFHFQETHALNIFQSIFSDTSCLVLMTVVICLETLLITGLKIQINVVIGIENL